MRVSPQINSGFAQFGLLHTLVRASDWATVEASERHSHPSRSVVGNPKLDSGRPLNQRTARIHSVASSNPVPLPMYVWTLREAELGSECVYTRWRMSTASLRVGLSVSRTALRRPSAAAKMGANAAKPSTSRYTPPSCLLLLSVLSYPRRATACPSHVVCCLLPWECTHNPRPD